MEYNLLLIGSFIVYSLGIVLIGVLSTRRKKETADDFLLASRELGPVVSALSASASAESGWVMLGLVGEAYLYGAAAFWIIPGIAAGYLFNWFVIAERLRKASAVSGAVTLPQYLLHRFGKDSKTIRVLSVLIITLSMLAYVAAQMNAAGKAFEATFSLPYIWGVFAGAAIILTYTISGGFRAVCWTDVIQALFMVIALIGMPILILLKIGGYGIFLNLVHQIDPSMLSFSYGKAGFAMVGFVVGLLGIGLGYPGQPHVLARFMATKDTKSVTRGGQIAISWMVLSYLGAIFFGLFAKVHMGVLADPEQALPLEVSELLPPVLGGFVIAAIVSAICSTADSQLIVVSSSISRDITPMFNKDNAPTSDFKKMLRQDRLVLMILGLLAVVLAATKSRVIFDFVLYAWSALGASFGPAVILGLTWKRTTRQGAIAGMLTGLIVTVVWRNVPQLKAIVYELVPAFIIALLMVVIISLITSRKEKQPDQI